MEALVALACIGLGGFLALRWSRKPNGNIDGQGIVLGLVIGGILLAVAGALLFDESIPVQDPYDQTAR